jgi:hypothetical protein
MTHGHDNVSLIVLTLMKKFIKSDDATTRHNEPLYFASLKYNVNDMPLDLRPHSPHMTIIMDKPT